MTLPAGSVVAILPAAGSSRRFGGETKKIFQLLGDSPVWAHAVTALRGSASVGRILVAYAEEDTDRWQGEYAALVRQLEVQLVPGGAERVDSVRAALELTGDTPWVAVHDAARPLLPAADLQRVLEVAGEDGAALLATRVRGTIKREQHAPPSDDNPRVQTTVDRSDLWEALTPQVFRTPLLREAYERWRGFPVTDDAQLVERMGHPVTLVEGSPVNLKITVAADLQVARALLDSPSR